MKRNDPSVQSGQMIRLYRRIFLSHLSLIYISFSPFFRHIFIPFLSHSIFLLRRKYSSAGKLRDPVRKNSSRFTQGCTVTRAQLQAYLILGAPFVCCCWGGPWKTPVLAFCKPWRSKKLSIRCVFHGAGASHRNSDTQKAFFFQRVLYYNPNISRTF